MATNEWPLKRLKDITSKIGSGATPRGGKNAYLSEGISLIRSLNVYDFKFEEDDLAFISDEQAAELSNVIVQKGDILLNITGASVARCCLTDPKYLPARVNQHVAIVRVRPDVADARFVLYCINSLHFKSRLLALAHGGATREALTKTTIEDFEVLQPPLPVQQRIASILSAYDELIENSQRRIKILEAMARALYREWFVHFRFPGHENHPRVASLLGEIPQGWEVKTVKEILSRRSAGSVYREADVNPEGDVPVIDQSTSELLGFHDNAPDHMASSALPMAIFGDHTCKMQLLIEPFSVGPNVVPFVASHEMPTSYVFYAANSLVHTQEYKRHWIPLTVKEVVVADREAAQRFASLIQPMLVTQETHRKAIRNLRRTRDLLLPRLLSGQIEVEALPEGIAA
ncbi:MAG: restriction endonuclease subunit S [Thiobacillaceae bacterium]